MQQNKFSVAAAKFYNHVKKEIGSVCKLEMDCYIFEYEGVSSFLLLSGFQKPLGISVGKMLHLIGRVGSLVLRGFKHLLHTGFVVSLGLR